MAQCPENDQERQWQPSQEAPRMTREEAFLEAILADLNDSGPRLMYADWLDEQGQIAEAAQVRVWGVAYLYFQHRAEAKWAEWLNAQPEAVRVDILSHCGLRLFDAIDRNLPRIPDTENAREPLAIRVDGEQWTIGGGTQEEATVVWVTNVREERIMLGPERINRWPPESSPGTRLPQVRFDDSRTVQGKRWMARGPQAEKGYRIIDLTKDGQLLLLADVLRSLDRIERWEAEQAAAQAEAAEAEPATVIARGLRFFRGLYARALGR